MPPRAHDLKGWYHMASNQERKTSLWYVEYRAYGRLGYMGKIEAESGNDAIKKVREKVIGVNMIIGVWHDDEEDDE